MITFSILRVHWGADAEYPQPDEQVLVHFVDVTIRFLDGFDWERDGAKLLKRMQTATKLNEENDGQQAG